MRIQNQDFGLAVKRALGNEPLLHALGIAADVKPGQLLKETLESRYKAQSYVDINAALNLMNRSGFKGDDGIALMYLTGEARGRAIATRGWGNSIFNALDEIERVRREYTPNA